MTIEEQMKELKEKTRELEAALSEKRRFDYAKKFLDQHDLEVTYNGRGFTFTKIEPEDIAKSRDTSVGYDEMGFPVLGFDYGNGGCNSLIVKTEEEGPVQYRKRNLMHEAQSCFSYSGKMEPQERYERYVGMMERIKAEWNY